MQRTLILVKPDAFARGLTGEIISRFERKGLRLVALEQRTLDAETAGVHYAEHKERPFFGELVDFITSGPLVAMVLEGHEAIAGEVADVLYFALVAASRGGISLAEVERILDERALRVTRRKGDAKPERTLP